MSRLGRYLRQHKGETIVVCALVPFIVAYLFCLPRDLFKGVPYSTVVLDRGGELLGARIADDGQWRFPPTEKVPEKFETCLIQFEDRAFKWHSGVNVFSLGRAVVQNIRAGHIVSGGSTITMQVIRMSRGRERTLSQKAIEAVLARRLEMRCSKDEILSLYASNAPFGGNVVGIDAAAWRYFSHDADDLSWGEAATLAILPNSPSSINVARRRDDLLAKRNRLLGRLLDRHIIDSTDYELACSEPLPDEPLPLPQYAPHLTDWYFKNSRGERVTTTVDVNLQAAVVNITDRWNESLSRNGVSDLSAVVMDVHTGEILAYVGNANASDKRPGAQVDIVRSPRSTGSILKPFLYCAMLQEGQLLPNTLLPDVPININGFSPQNFDLQFAGAVPASEALARSLNVPAVQMLRTFGVPRFHLLLREAGMSTLPRDASHYGLSLILGGAEGTLMDITKMYASLSASYQGLKWASRFPLDDRVALWWTFDALKEVNRPDEIDWKLISSVRKVAWKTGTSYGFRDAWAVGVTADYAVGVWAGNAEGQGSAGLVGARTAGPVLFDIFNVLPRSEWFEIPDEDEGVLGEVCKDSGHLAGIYCSERDTLLLPRKSIYSEMCPYHTPVTLSENGEYRVDAGYPGSHIETMFLLPPSMEWYYRTSHPEYRPLPPKAPGSVFQDSYSPMEFIYPEGGSVISIPRQLDGSLKGIVFNLAHTDPSTEVYWHLDDSYVGATRYVHQMTLIPEHGHHTVTVVDVDGATISVGFTID